MPLMGGIFNTKNCTVQKCAIYFLSSRWIPSMKNYRSTWILLALASIAITACSPQFSSLNHSCPKPSPVMSSNTMTELARNGIQAMPKGDNLKLVIPTDSFFRVNSPTIKQDKMASLGQVVDILKSYGDVTVKIVGYTDNTPENKITENLSLARARAVLAYLWAHGLDAEHLYAVGLGDQDSVADSHDVETNAANRRVEIIVHAHCATYF